MRNSFLLMGIVALASIAVTPSTFAKPSAGSIPVKVVIVTMFEVGADTGDRPGELQYWVERDHLDQVIPLPAAYHDVRMNSDGELAVVTGQGTAHAAATIMALGLDPRFDLSHAYWLIAGIAGASPDAASLGSAVWANWVVDGDLAYEIDARELPPNWSTGMLPLGKKEPFELPVEARVGQLYQTNRALMDWAYFLTRNTKLEDSDKLKEIRSHFEGKRSQNPPQVLLGDEVSGSTYWHGKLMEDWATKWMDYYSGGKGRYATTAMEDTGTLQSLEYLSKAGKVDGQRVLVLRTVSNFDRQPRGMDAAISLSNQRIGAYGAYLPSLEAAYAVGHTVVAELLKGWDSHYKELLPETVTVSGPPVASQN
jgi:purine nucleoside permease